MSSKVSVSGSMNYVDSDSSSDSDDSVDASNTTHSGSLPSRLILDDDKEELEVFGAHQTIESNASSNKSAVNDLHVPPPSSRLIDLMAKSVAKVESGEQTSVVLTPPKPPRPPTTMEASNKKKEETGVDISDEPDMFGISYKPYNKQIYLYLSLIFICPHWKIAT